MNYNFLSDKSGGKGMHQVTLVTPELKLIGEKKVFSGGKIEMIGGVL